jgi:hypothetical protein
MARYRGSDRDQCGAAAGSGYLLFQARDLSRQFVQAHQQAIHPALIHLPAALPRVDQQPQVARRIVLLPAETQQLDLKLAFIQRGLRLLAEGFELLIQPVEQCGLGHRVLPIGVIQTE